MILGFPTSSRNDSSSSTTSGGPYSFYAAGIPASAFVDAGVTNGTAYFYVVTAVNQGMVESLMSSEAWAIPQG